MSKGELISKLLKLDPQLAVRVLRNDKLSAKIKIDALLKELRIEVKRA